MPLSQDQVLRILYPGSVEGRSRRFTQDTPILPDVWLEYGRVGGEPVELLLTPHHDVSSAKLAQALLSRLEPSASKSRRGSRSEENGSAPLGFNDSHVFASLTLRQLVQSALPLSGWWRAELGQAALKESALRQLAKRRDLVDLLLEPGRQDETSSFPENVLNFVRIAGAISLGEPIPERAGARLAYARRVVEEAASLLAAVEVPELSPPLPLWSVFTNRKATAAISQSRACVKADAAVRLFEIRCRGIRFAVMDSGVDATHPAFQSASPAPVKGRKPATAATSRVVKTLDFTRLKELLTVAVDEATEAAPGRKPKPKPKPKLRLADTKVADIRRDIRQRLQDGRPLDWDLLEPALSVAHDASYEPPENEHGTHVAGIIAADWEAHESTSGKSEPLFGMCRDIELYDLRIIGSDGTGDEFCILAALQYVRYLNQTKGRTVIHGVNLSISIPHAASSFACGQTPICEEVNRLVNSGVVVVVAAGNGGYAGAGVANASDYRDISITDPGNADLAITVGATHRYQPHRYGVSYFSSRGPTGDGRLKPDLVAPGEQILSCVPGGKSVVLDGTSMAAPHVSGAAALLMARNKELIGDPWRIKSIICGTATDLGRARDFQGAGLLDVLRALQST